MKIIFEMETMIENAPWSHVTQHDNCTNTSVPQLMDKKISSHRRIKNPDGPRSWVKPSKLEIWSLQFCSFQRNSSS